MSQAVWGAYEKARREKQLPAGFKQWDVLGYSCAALEALLSDLARELPPGNCYMMTFPPGYGERKSAQGTKDVRTIESKTVEWTPTQIKDGADQTMIAFVPHERKVVLTGLGNQSFDYVRRHGRLRLKRAAKFVFGCSLEKAIYEHHARMPSDRGSICATCFRLYIKPSWTNRSPACPRHYGMRSASAAVRRGCLECQRYEIPRICTSGKPKSPKKQTVSYDSAAVMKEVEENLHERHEKSKNQGKE